MGKWYLGSGEKNQKMGVYKNQGKYNTVVMSHSGLQLKLPMMNLEGQFCLHDWVHFFSCVCDVSNEEADDLML